MLRSNHLWVRVVGLVSLTGVVAIAACTIFTREVKVPPGSGAAVIVGSAGLVQPAGGIARHPWISLRPEGTTVWERWEVMCCPNSSEYSTVKRGRRPPTSDYGGGGGDVRFHAVIEGERAGEIIRCVRDAAPRYPHRNTYRAFPGPNSNTFVDWLIRECDIGVELPAPSIGRDYRGVIGASTTAGGTGVQIETPLVGLKVGLTEGIEVHILGMAIGVDWWPPAIIVPVGPGRIGFDDR